MKKPHPLPQLPFDQGLLGRALLREVSPPAVSSFPRPAGSLRARSKAAASPSEYAQNASPALATARGRRVHVTGAFPALPPSPPLSIKRWLAKQSAAQPCREPPPPPLRSEALRQPLPSFPHTSPPPPASPYPLTMRRLETNATPLVALGEAEAAAPLVAKAPMAGAEGGGVGGGYKAMEARSREGRAVPAARRAAHLAAPLPHCWAGDGGG